MTYCLPLLDFKKESNFFMSDSSLPSCGSVSGSSVDDTTSDSPVSSCSNSDLSPATVEEIVNWTLGKKLLDGFYPDDTYEVKEHCNIF